MNTQTPAPDYAAALARLRLDVVSICNQVCALLDKGQSEQAAAMLRNARRVIESGGEPQAAAPALTPAQKAAPQLLAALRAVLADFDGVTLMPPGLADKCRAAIAAATVPEGNTAPAAQGDTLAALRVKADIPNAAGFLLELVRADGSKQFARVAVESATGCHYCATPSGKRIELAPFAGWIPYSPPVPFAVPGHIPNGAPHFWTRQQCRQILTARGVTEREPAKGAALTVCFPEEVTCLARITVAEGKSTDGKTLFACQFYRKA